MSLGRMLITPHGSLLKRSITCNATNRRVVQMDD